jgi:hypothetical protein
MAADVKITRYYNQRQRSINNLCYCQYSNSSVIWSLLHIIYVLPACFGKKDTMMIPTPFRESASMERQRFSAVHCGLFMFILVTDIHFSDIGCLYLQKQ